MKKIIIPLSFIVGIIIINASLAYSSCSIDSHQKYIALSDSGIIDPRFRGHYQVTIVTNGHVSEGRKIDSQHKPIKMTALVTVNAVKIIGKEIHEYRDLGERMVNEDSSFGRTTHYLCNDSGPDLKMIVINEKPDGNTIVIGIINMTTLEFVDYELKKLK